MMESRAVVIVASVFTVAILISWLAIFVGIMTR